VLPIWAAHPNWLSQGELDSLCANTELAQLRLPAPWRCEHDGEPRETTRESACAWLPEILAPFFSIKPVVGVCSPAEA